MSAEAADPKQQVGGHLNSLYPPELADTLLCHVARTICASSLALHEMERLTFHVARTICASWLAFPAMEKQTFHVSLGLHGRTFRFIYTSSREWHLSC